MTNLKYQKDEEIFDLVDENDQVVGQATRKQCHNNPNLIHRMVGLFIVSKQGQILLQKRSQFKDLNPGLWTFSVSGHVDKDKDYTETIVKEINEEIGVNIDFSLIKPIKKILMKTSQQREMGMIFVCRYGGPINFNQEEIEKMAWFNLEEIIRQIKSQKILVSPSFNIAVMDKDVQDFLSKFISNI